MTVTATYVGASAKVTVVISSAPANASTVLIERSTDQVRWTAVRGTTPPATLSGGTFSVDDYEFSDAVVNYYRATYYDASTPAPVGTPAAATAVTSAGASVGVTPTMPSGLAVGEVVFVALGCTKSTAGCPAAPTGWTLIALGGDGNAIYTADWTASLTMPTFTVTALASGDIVVAKAFAYRNVATSAANVQAQTNASAQNIAFPAFPGLGTNQGPMVAFKRSTNTTLSPTPTYTNTATGWTIAVYTNAATTVGGTITVTGGAAATSDVLQSSMNARAFTSQETASTTPSLGTVVWLKNPTKPYLNRAVTTIGVSDSVHKSRSATFDVIGRTMPIAVTDLFSGRNLTLTVRALDRPTTDDVESTLMAGDVIFVHAPKGAVTPTGYFLMSDVTRQRPANTGTARYLVIPLAEVAQPSPVLAAVLSTWQTVISTYATWQDVINAKATWQDVLQLVGSASDVITG